MSVGTRHRRGREIVCKAVDRVVTRAQLRSSAVRRLPRRRRSVSSRARSTLAKSWGAYVLVGRAPHVQRVSIAMFLGRLPNGMLPLGIVLLIDERLGSYAISGAALAAFMVGTTVSAPIRGRAVDRWGQFRVLLPLSLTQMTALCAFTIAVLAGGSALTLMLLGAVVGASGSTLGGSMRALWPALVHQDQLPTAYSLQAFLEDLISLAGPLVVAIVLVLASPSSVLAVAGIASFIGTAMFIATPASRAAVGRARAGRGRRPSLNTSGMRTLGTTLLCGGVVTGILTVAVPAFAKQEGPSWAGGVLLAVMGAGSVVGGASYGAAVWRSSAGRRYVWLTGAFASAVALLAAAHSMALLGVLLALVGLTYAPRVSTAYLLLDELAPCDALTQGYTWLVSATAGGRAVGAAVGGLVVQHLGVHWTLALAGVSAGTAAILATAGRRTLTPLVPGARSLPQSQGP